RFQITPDWDALEAAARMADQASRAIAPGLLGGLGEPFLAQPVNRRFHVAVGLTKRRFAIHHARAGLVAELLDHLSGYICFRHCGDPVCRRQLASPPPGCLAGQGGGDAGGVRPRAHPSLSPTPRTIMLPGTSSR